MKFEDSTAEGFCIVEQTGECVGGNGLTKAYP